MKCNCSHSPKSSRLKITMQSTAGDFNQLNLKHKDIHRSKHMLCLNGSQDNTNFLYFPNT